MSDLLDRVVPRWSVMWKSKNMVDGQRQYIMWHHGQPLLFTTRAGARAWIEENYGYIKTRQDLRVEPHGWRLPEAVKVDVVIRRKV